MRVLSFLVRMALVVGCALTLGWGLILLGFSYHQLYQLAWRWTLHVGELDTILRPLLTELNRLFWGVTLLSASAGLYQYAARGDAQEQQESSIGRTLLLLLLSTCCLLVSHTLDLPARNPLTYVYLTIVVLALCLSIRFARSGREENFAYDEFVIAEPPEAEAWTPRQRKLSDPFFAAEMSFLDDRAEIPKNHRGWKILASLGAAGLAAFWLATHKILPPKHLKPEPNQAVHATHAAAHVAVTQEPASEVAFLTVGLYSEPTQARIYVDGEALGVTPITVTLAEGEHRVALEKEGYAVVERSIVMPYPESSAHFALAPAYLPPALQGRAGLKVLCDRNVARRVYLDDVDTGINCPTTHRLEVAPGSHKVTIFSPPDGKKFEFVRDIEDSHFSTRIYLRP